MKKLIFTMMCMFGAPVLTAHAQTAEVTQLILNLEKLNELRKILAELKKGYQILENGYNTIKDLSEGNFKLHKNFLDGLLAVSPAVKNYVRIKDIIACQLEIISACKKASAKLHADQSITAAELGYIDKVYDELTSASIKNLDALLTIITDKELRASDAERLTLIDQLYEDISSQLTFVKHFNSNALVLSSQRQNEKADAVSVEQLFDIKP